MLLNLFHSVNDIIILNDNRDFLIYIINGTAHLNDIFAYMDCCSYLLLSMDSWFESAAFCQLFLEFGFGEVKFIDLSFHWPNFFILRSHWPMTFRCSTSKTLMKMAALPSPTQVRFSNVF